MEVVNIHEAKTHLSRLVEKAANGEPFIIAKSGKPMVKVMPLEETGPTERFGFFADIPMEIPDDFNRWGDAEIGEMFGIKP